jgi:hypothetical protein
MPIILKFYYNHTGDVPNNCEITPRDPQHNAAKRMASPIILRPLMLQNRQSCGMVLRLQAERPTGLDITFMDPTVTIPAGTILDGAKLRRTSLAAYPNSPLSGRSTKGSAVAAFLHYAERQGFKEV